MFLPLERRLVVACIPLAVGERAYPGRGALWQSVPAADTWRGHDFARWNARVNPGEVRPAVAWCNSFTIHFGALSAVSHLFFRVCIVL